jgi:hypothetical protein
MINEKENSVLLIAGFTQREINTQKQKFHNLFRIEPWLVPMRRHGECVGLTDDDIEDEWERITGHSIYGGSRSEGRTMYLSPDEVFEFARAIEAKSKEKNT